MLIGHQTQWQFLIKSFQAKRLSHAFLFFGERKLGKKTFAFEFAKFLNCENPCSNQQPCQKCQSCQSIKKKYNPDLIFIKPQKKEIQIAQIRELCQKLYLKPYNSPFKVLVLDKAHQLNAPSQHCFLKTLEEPTDNSILILITEHPEKLLPTILSRTQKIKFVPLSAFEIKEYLEKNSKLSTNLVQKIIWLSEGKPGLVIDFLSNPQKLKNYEEKLTEINKICQLPLWLKFEYAKKNSKKSHQEIREILNIWLKYFREIFIFKTQKKEIFNKDFGLFFRQASERYSLSQIKKILNALDKTQVLIDFTNVNTRLALEILMLKL